MTASAVAAERADDEEHEGDDQQEPQRFDGEPDAAEEERQENDEEYCSHAAAVPTVSGSHAAVTREVWLRGRDSNPEKRINSPL